MELNRHGLDEIGFNREPNRTPSALRPVVENYSGQRSGLPSTGTVADTDASPRTVLEPLPMSLAGVDYPLKLHRRRLSARTKAFWKMRAIGDRRRLYIREAGWLDYHSGMRSTADNVVRDLGLWLTDVARTSTLNIAGEVAAKAPSVPKGQWLHAGAVMPGVVFS